MQISTKIVRPIVVDYETYYSPTCSVKSDMKREWVGGPWHYTHLKDYYPYMVSWWDLESRESGVIDIREKLPQFVASLAGRTVISHNCLFEHAVSKQILPEFNPLNMVDTADIAAYFQCPRHLAGATQFLLGEHLDKSPRESMNGVHYNELSAERKVAMRKYALDDSITTGRLYEKLFPLWPEVEFWASNLNREQNWQGINVDSNYLESQIEKMQQVRGAAIRQIPWCETDEDTPLSAKKLAIWCREQGIEPPTSLAEDDEACMLWEAFYGEKYPVVGAMRDFRKSNTFLKKLRRIELLVRPDGTMPMDTLYFAAVHTGRFSSRGVNLQNLPKDTQFCDLRGCLIPPTGSKFVSSDLAGIEARCLPYLAGDTDYLSEVARLDNEAGGGETGDLYEPHARRMFGYSDSRPLRKVDKDLRFATKTCVLALGYQSGARKFHKTISLGVPKQVLDRVRQGEETDEQLALRLVKLYRSSNPKIPGLWYMLDGELRSSCQTGTDYKVQLPQGRVINYFNLATRESIDVEGRSRAEIIGSVCKGEDRVKLYGGKITENICQAFARDVFVNSVYNLVKAGIDVRMGVHDEALAEVKNEDATIDTRRNIEKLMAKTPDWAPGLPLAAETTILDRYAK